MTVIYLKFDFLAIFHEKCQSNRQNTAFFVISGSDLLEIDTSLAQIQKFYFWRPFWFFSKTRSAILVEVIDRFCWFSIANNGRQLCTLYQLLKKIKAKLRPWECRIEKVQNCCHDVIDFEISKSEKKITGKYPPDHLWKV